MSQSPGSDGIHTVVLREISENITETPPAPSTCSLAARKPPAEWKSSVVCPLFKGLPCLTCKVMETVIAARLQNHLLLNQILLPERHSFCPCSSCNTNVLLAGESWGLPRPTGTPRTSFLLISLECSTRFLAVGCLDTSGPLEKQARCFIGFHCWRNIFLDILATEVQTAIHLQ